MIQSRWNKFFTLRAVRHRYGCPEKFWISLKVFRGRLDEVLSVFWQKVPMAVALEPDGL